MDLLKRLGTQFQQLWQAMTPSQRAILIVVPLLVLTAFGALSFQQSQGQYTALSWGKVFSTDELIQAEQALINAGLKDFQRQGQRIMVPESEKDRYNAALLEFDATPSDLGEQMLQQISNLGPFSTEKQRQETREAMLLQEIRRTLRAIPDLEDARVVIANPARRSSLVARGKVTANVTVRPKSGRDLSQRLVHSIQAAVASMVPDLKAADVTVFDQVHGISFTGESSDDPFDSRIMQRVREFTRHHEQQILKHLDYIPQVGVTVNVDLDNLKSSVTRTQNIDKEKSAPVVTNEFTVTDSHQQRPARGEAGLNPNRPASLNPQPGQDRTRQYSESDNRTVNGVSFEVTEKQLLAAMPKAVQVSISIPRDFYRSVAAERTARGEKDNAKLDVANIEKQYLESIRRSVSRLIPLGSPQNSVEVVTIDRLPNDTPEPQIPLWDRLQPLIQQWTGPIGLVVLALVALVMIRRAMPAAEAAAPRETIAQRLAAAQQEPEPELNPKPKELTKRDRIQTIVRDNPEQAAALISRWMQTAA